MSNHLKPLAKLLSSQGFTSNRQAKNILLTSEIFVNGVAFDPEIGSFDYGDVLEIDGERLEIRKNIYCMLHKPVGHEVSHKPSHHPSVFDLFPIHYMNRGLQAAGRLDVDTSGLLLLSDDGQFIHQLISGKRKVGHEIEKIYEIVTARPIEPRQLEALLTGVLLHDEPEPVIASRIIQTGEFSLTLGITTGKYHQVRRMVAAVGNHVERLHRTQVGPYLLPSDLKPGEYVHVDWPPR